jgi:hypothetical protein
VLLGTYQQLGNRDKLTDVANRLLQVDANNLRALALLTYLKGEQARAGGPQATQALTEGQQFAERGLKALQTMTKPANQTDADFEKTKSGMAAIFDGVAGLAALQSKNFADAQKYLAEAVKIDPTNLSNVYPLALAYLQATPPDQVKGIWCLARAVNLSAGTAAQASINKYGRSAYIKYHGNDQGWQEVVQTAASNPEPPADFKIAPRPTPAEEAAELVKTKKVSDMSFDEFQMIFTSGNQQAVDTVWSEIKGKPIAFAAKVVEATPTKLTLSATAEDIEKNLTDVTLNMVAPIPAKLLPKPGAMTQVQGDPVSFTVTPFALTMSNGTLIGVKEEAPAKPAAGKPAAKKPAAKRR